jgi:hypothetical protein
MALHPSNTPAINASATNTAFFFLLTIEPPSGTPPIYLVNNTQPVTSNGITYQPYPFSTTLPMDTGDKIPSIQLTIDNVDQSLTNAIRELEEAPNIRLQLVTSDFPDLVEKDLNFLRLRNVNYDAMTITGVLEVASIWARKFPSERVDPVAFPALFY